MSIPRLQRQKKAEAGFTLVELMVSLTAFSIVMTISTGTLLVLVDMNAKAQALYSATTNLSFALDSMAREVRTGYHYYCADATSGNVEDVEDRVRNCEGGKLIAFIREESGTQMAYRYNETDQSIEQNDGTGWMAITADEVAVTDFSITVEHANTYLARPSFSDLGGDENQPVVKFQVRGYVNNGLDTNTDFFIQTHIVQRRLDIL